MQSVGKRLDFGMDRCLAVCIQRTDCGCILSKNVQEIRQIFLRKQSIYEKMRRIIS